MSQKNTLEKIYTLFDSLKPDEYGCINFPGIDGYYHKVWLNGKQREVHRIALERKLGRPIKPGYKALHHCDWRSCINPEHLYEGTQKDNVQDTKDRFPGYMELERNLAAKARAAKQRSSNH